MRRAILFDAYGTLFDEGKESVPKISADIVRKFKLEVTPGEFFEEWKRVYLAIESKVVFRKRPFKTIKEINLESLAATFEKFSINSSPSEFVDKLFRLWSSPKLFPECKEVLTKLRENYVLGILSNTDNETLLSAVSFTGLKLDYILTSEEARSYKPNTDLFVKACNDLEQNMNSVVYVGNSPNDVIGAKKAGLIMILVNRRNESLNNPPFFPDYEAISLQAVPKIVRALLPN